MDAGEDKSRLIVDLADFAGQWIHRSGDNGGAGMADREVDGGWLTYGGLLGCDLPAVFRDRNGRRGAGIVHAVIDDGELQGLGLADKSERWGVDQAQLTIRFLTLGGE